MPDEQKYKNVDVKKEALEAEKRIRPYVLETPLEYSRYLSQLGHNKVYLKLENTQRTGSFKFRGAANHILSLKAGAPSRALSVKAALPQPEPAAPFKKGNSISFS